MTKDDIIRMAIEAGEYADLHHEKHGSWLDAERHQFANLVAAAERKALRDEMWKKAMKLVSEAVKYEREACDQLCQEIDGGDNMFSRAIRARSRWQFQDLEFLPNAPQLENGTLLYTSPPQRQPLTNEEIWQMVNDCSFNRDLHADKFARAIEAKHGIGDKT